MSRWTKPTPLHEEKFLGRTFAPDIPDDATEEELLLPATWGNLVGFLADGDRIRCRNDKKKIDFFAVIMGVGAGGIILEKEGACITPAVYARLDAAEKAAIKEDQDRQLATIGPRPQVTAT